MDAGAVTIVLVAVVLLAIGAVAALRIGRRRLRRLRDDHGQRPKLWEKFYAHDWGETSTNNYGFAPAPGDHPQRFQQQMYREMLKRLRQAVDPGTRVELLEVSCGRGGGLAAIAGDDPGLDGTGLDVAHSAVDFCRRTHGANPRLNFVQGNALQLPFADGSFDALLNVEASNDYGDRPGFYREVARVLRPGGLFLYTDSFRARDVDTMKAELADAGFAADFDNITANVAEACRLDSPRRQQVIDDHVPWVVRKVYRRQLAKYAGLAGSGKHRAFVSGKRQYLMTAARKA